MTCDSINIVEQCILEVIGQYDSYGSVLLTEKITPEESDIDELNELLGCGDDKKNKKGNGYAVKFDLVKKSNYGTVQGIGCSNGVDQNGNPIWFKDIDGTSLIVNPPPLPLADGDSFIMLPRPSNGKVEVVDGLIPSKNAFKWAVVKLADNRFAIMTCEKASSLADNGPMGEERDGKITTLIDVGDFTGADTFIVANATGNEAAAKRVEILKRAEKFFANAQKKVGNSGLNANRVSVMQKTTADLELTYGASYADVSSGRKTQNGTKPFTEISNSEKVWAVVKEVKTTADGESYTIYASCPETEPNRKLVYKWQIGEPSSHEMLPHMFTQKHVDRVDNVWKYAHGFGHMVYGSGWSNVGQNQNRKSSNMGLAEEYVLTDTGLILVFNYTSHQLFTIMFPQYKNIRAKFGKNLENLGLPNTICKVIKSATDRNVNYQLNNSFEPIFNFDMCELFESFDLSLQSKRG